MFFRKKIQSIRSTDKVLEVGPGSTPHPRSNEFLELSFRTDEERVQQRGEVISDPQFGSRPVHYYEGGTFPFKNDEFDYVICSHVIEHVDNPVFFMAEVFRVGGGRGYLEYPMIPYEYMYNFDVHKHFVKFDTSTHQLCFLPKAETNLSEFSGLNSLFRQMLSCNWDDLCAANKALFFEGFEFDRVFSVRKTRDINSLLPDLSAIVPKKLSRRVVGKIFNILGL